MTLRRASLQAAQVLAAVAALPMCFLQGLSVASEGGSPGKNAVLTRIKDTDAFEFETADIKGTIQPQGAYHGVTRLVDRRSGTQLIDPRYSALNLFKLQSVNHYMGQPREMP